MEQTNQQDQSNPSPNQPLYQPMGNTYSVASPAPAIASVPKKFIRLLIAGLLDAALLILVVVSFVRYVDGMTEMEFIVAIGLFSLIFALPAAFGATLGIRAFVKNTLQTASTFKTFSLVLMVASCIIAILLTVMAVIAWTGGFENGNFITAGFLGLTTIGAFFAVPPAVVYIVAFVLATTAYSSMKRHLNIAPVGVMSPILQPQQRNENETPNA